MNTISRRHFLKLSATGVGSLALSQFPFTSFAQTTEEPHFFLQIAILGGFDSTYLWDARPLELTQKGLMQNYLGEEPLQIKGLNGTTTWATKLTQPLEKYRDHFSIINGVLMATDFDGHQQNVDYLFTGNSFGGESFIPYVNQKGKASQTPIDGIVNSSLSLTSNNEGSVVPLALSSFNNLRPRLNSAVPFSGNAKLFDYVQSRMKALSEGEGRFSKGSLKMFEGYQYSGDLYSKLTHIPEIPVNAEGDVILDFMNLSFELFKSKITRTAVINITHPVDTHNLNDAKKQPDLFKAITADLEKIIKVLKETPFDEKRSFMDVTTFMFSTEFGRTMKTSPSTPVDQTGTDHNPLTNMILLGGKKIKGGTIFGAGDFQSASEKISGAHLQLDQRQIKVMGRPFDFEQSIPLPSVAEKFDPYQYLTVNSVVNTLYSAFDLPLSLHRNVVRNGSRAKVIKGLIK